jgi:hypothetical protein
VSLVTLSDDEGVDRPALRGRRVKHRRSYRIGAEGQPSHGVELQIIDQVQHDTADKGSTSMVKRQTTEVYIEVGFLSRRQRHLAPNYGQIMDKFQQVVTVRHE